jgi:HTH-type transcriptional regulator/antitoxin HipB
MTVTRERASTPADLGRRLAALRAKRGLTQTDVANALGISRRYVSEIEAGKPSLYSERLFRLLDLLDAGLFIEGEGVA